MSKLDFFIKYHAASIDRKRYGRIETGVPTRADSEHLKTLKWWAENAATEISRHIRDLESRIFKIHKHSKVLNLEADS